MQQWEGNVTPTETHDQFSMNNITYLTYFTKCSLSLELLACYYFESDSSHFSSYFNRAQVFDPMLWLYLFRLYTVCKLSINRIKSRLNNDHGDSVHAIQLIIAIERYCSLSTSAMVLQSGRTFNTDTSSVTHNVGH